jgi:hypothetical protein
MFFVGDTLRPCFKQSPEAQAKKPPQAALPRHLSELASFLASAPVLAILLSCGQMATLRLLSSASYIKGIEVGEGAPYRTIT